MKIVFNSICLVLFIMLLQACSTENPDPTQLKHNQKITVYGTLHQVGSVPIIEFALNTPENHQYFLNFPKTMSKKDLNQFYRKPLKVEGIFKKKLLRFARQKETFPKYIIVIESIEIIY